jgi:hypothetical protein
MAGFEIAALLFIFIEAEAPPEHYFIYCWLRRDFVVFVCVHRKHSFLQFAGKEGARNSHSLLALGRNDVFL